MGAGWREVMSEWKEETKYLCIRLIIVVIIVLRLIFDLCILVMLVYLLGDHFFFSPRLISISNVPFANSTWCIEIIYWIIISSLQWLQCHKAHTEKETSLCEFQCQEISSKVSDPSDRSWEKKHCIQHTHTQWIPNDPYCVAFNPILAKENWGFKLKPFLLFVLQQQQYHLSHKHFFCENRVQCSIQLDIVQSFS